MTSETIVSGTAANRNRHEAAVVPANRQSGARVVEAFVGTPLQLTKSVLATLRRAITTRCKVDIACRDGDERASRRKVRPLQLEFWGNAFTLTGWCEFCTDFRVFRCDRITECELLSEGFREEKGKRLSDFLAHINGNKEK